MRRTIPTICSVALLVALPLPLPAQTAPVRIAAPPGPNFVVLLADDLGYGDLGCFGHPTIKTPNLDRMAAQGLKLTSCYAGAPVCSPSRAALMTGRIPQRYGINDWIKEGSAVHLPRHSGALAETLRISGYATCMVGKWHLNGKMDGSQPTPGDHGFEHWFATQNNAAPSHENPVNFVRNGKPVGPLTGYSSTVVVDEAVAWLKQRRDQRPFFLYVAFHAPHEPVATAAEFVQPYAGAGAADKAQYFGNVAQLDHEVGRLLTALDELRQTANTLVLFTSDNGPETLNRYPAANRSHGSPGKVNGKSLRGMKLHLYEGGIRVPAVVRWPNVIKPRRVSDDPVSGMDVLPTLLELAGVKLEIDEWTHLYPDGVSFAPLLRGRKFVRGRPIYWQYDNAPTASRNDTDEPRVALRDGDWKLLERGNYKTFELYNLKLDPGETTNVAQFELGRLQSLLERMRLIHNQIKLVK